MPPQPPTPPAPVVPFLRVMSGRDPHEPGRVATSLELFFDLVFVAAVAATAAQLRHALHDGQYAAGATGYLLAFMALWWAWMNYTWFASAYDNDDTVFRLTTFVIMGGALVMAASESDIFTNGQSVPGVLGYVVMRVGMVVLWLRAAHDHPERRASALRYAVGITLAQTFWVARLFITDPTWILPSFLLGFALELLVPVIAEKHGRTPFHPHHLAERYGLLTLIVLGEVVLATVQAIQGVLSPENATTMSVPSGELWLLIVGAFALVCSLWWVYFKSEHGALFQGRWKPWAIGYGHYFIFAAVAALGGSLAAGIDVIEHQSQASPSAIVGAVAASVSIFIAVLTSLRALIHPRPVRYVVQSGAWIALIIVIAATVDRVGLGVALIAATTSALVIVHVVECTRLARASDSAAV